MKCMNTKMTERLSDKDVLPIFLARKMSISTLIYGSAGDAVTFFESEYFVIVLFVKMHLQTFYVRT